MNRHPALMLVALFILICFGIFGLNALKKNAQTLQLKDVQLSNRSNELKLELKKSQLLEKRLNDGTEKSQEQIDSLQREIEQRKANEQRLERELQAKLERKRKDMELASSLQQGVSQAVLQPAVIVPTARPAVTGNKESWLRASGIPQSEWVYVDMIVSRESGWNPCAYNPGRSDCSANPTSACGLAQSLPCGKQSVYGHWTDPVANLKWQYDYVRQRYGGYAGAVAFWNANKWY